MLLIFSFLTVKTTLKHLNYYFMNQASLEGIKAAIKSLTIWSSKDYWLLGVSIVSLSVSIVALLIYRKALKVSQEQNITANSIELKNSYTYIISKTPNPIDDVDGKFDIFMKTENSLMIKRYVYDFLEDLTKQQQKTDCIRIFNSWIDIINIGLLQKINSDKHLLKYHKLELILYFGEVYKLNYINFNDHDLQSVPSEDNIPIKEHIAYKKFRTFETLKSKYETFTCS